MKMGFPDRIGVNLFLLKKKTNPFVCTLLKLCKAAQAAEVVVAKALVVVRLGQSQANGFPFGGGTTPRELQLLVQGKVCDTPMC